MGLFRNVAGAALAVYAANAVAQSPYEIHGLHTELVFTEAMAKAEKLGGHCQITPQTPNGEKTALCEFLPCSARTKDGACEQQGAKSAGLTIASQPILRISLEAPRKSARLTRINILFEGNHDAVSASLKQEFGPPDSDDTPADGQSWSHAQRLNWTRGHYRMGLLNSPKLIILGADRQ